MCRFLVYKGSDEILLSKLILDPSHSILTQSFDSRLRLDTRRPHNGDGFGIGYYTDPKLGPEPCIFTSTLPAWNCTNLQRIASKTASPLIFAHVRATTEGSLSDDNCHPFAHGSLMWMHNGGLGGWKHIKRRLGDRLADKWYLGVQGGTDSEWAFALFLDTLERSGYNPSSPPEGGFGPGALRKTLLKTIKQINDFIDDIPVSVRKTEEVDTRSLLNFAITDGHSVICSRYVSSCTDEAASLYYSSGTTWDDKMKGNFQMDRRDKGADIVLVASEPLTFERDNWVTVPTNSTLTIHNQTVMVHPIIDKYYNHNPYHSRSSKFVAEKGLISNDKGVATPQRSLIPTPLSSPELTHEFKPHLPPSRMQEIVTARGLTPEPHSFTTTHQGGHSPGGSSDSSNTSSSVEELPRTRTNNNTPDLSGRRTNTNTPDIPVSLRRERNTPSPEISRRTNIINTSISPRTREGDAFSFQEYPNRAEEEYPLTLRPSQSLSLRPQEMSNRKKKRSLGGRQPQLELQTSLRSAPPRQGREGGANSAAKIAQYFPELAGSR